MSSRFLLIILLINCGVVASTIDDVRVKLNSGQAHLSEEKFQLALADCKIGVKMLGEPTYEKGSRDDNSLKLTLAKVSEQKGQLKLASTITCNVLEDRLISSNLGS